MKIFLSWSGERSQKVAQILDRYLPRIIQAAKPFISSRSIQKGARGGEVIAAELAGTNFGIICLTPENQEKPWILFETGALSKLPDARVCPYLFELTPSQVAQPLGTFQMTRAIEQETFALISDMNTTLATPLSEDVLRDTFNHYWPEIERDLTAIGPPPKGDEIRPARSQDDVMAEILTTVRSLAASSPVPMAGTSPAASYYVVPSEGLVTEAIRIGEATGNAELAGQLQRNFAALRRSIRQGAHQSSIAERCDRTVQLIQEIMRGIHTE